MSRIFVLGGYQTDFACHLAREGASMADLVREVAQGGLQATLDLGGSATTCVSFVVGRAA